MTEDFIDFDSESFNPNSPNYLPPQFMESFLKTDLGPFEIPDLMPKNDMIDHNDQRPIDALSNDSNSSTNYSNKHSPESLDYTDNQSGIDRRSEDEGIKRPKDNHVMKKGIQKQYESFVDNNNVYTYEDNTQEYKKARKRLQNRESATRVRNKKKQYVEELEGEMAEVKRENADLRVQNASLRAENNLLKQQTCFLEKMVMKGPQYQPYQSISNAPNTYNDRDFHECLLPLVSKAEESSSSKNHGYFRAAPPHTFKKHTAMLGVFTLLLCTYGLMGQGSTGADDAIYPGSLETFKNNYGLTPRSVNDEDAGYGVRNQAQLDLSLEALIKANAEYNSLKWWVKTMVIAVYVGYFIYVLLITNWRYVFRIKNKKTL